MSEKFPNPTQININRKGGLYDQAIQENINRDGGLYDEALAEDARRAQMLPPNANNDLINYVSEQVLNEGARQHQTLDQDKALNDILAQQLEADTTWQQKRDQDEAYATYAENIKATQDREKAEYNEHKLELQRAKSKLLLSRIGAIAMWIPGIDIVGSMIKEEATTLNLNRARRQQYIQKNGSDSLGATIKNKYDTDRKNHKEQRRIIEDRGALVEEYERNHTR